MESTSTFETLEPTSPGPLIYVVDDEPLVGQVVDICLRTAGYQTRLFHDPIEAVHAFEAALRKPDLLLADFQMPGMNGMEVIFRCKTCFPELKTISISGTLHVDELETFPIKPDIFIHKPFFPRELLEPVKTLLARPPAALRTATTPA